MICEIPTLEKASEIMGDALEIHGTLKFEWFHPLAFDLDESLDPNEVETKIVKCRTCDLTTHLTLSGRDINYCPHCGGEHLKVMVDVLLVIQGSVVIHTAWRKP